MRSRSVGVSPRPGFTTSMQEVILDRNVRLLDSPGVLFDDRSAMLGNCVDAESIEDPIPAVEALLKRCDHASLLMTYNIPNFPPGDVMMFLAMVARSYGRVLKGGVPDKVSAARAVLKDWNNGKIQYYTAPPKDSAPEVGEDAVIVSKFGKEFDLSKHDDEVMRALKDQDEMDFVKVEDKATEMGGASREAVDFFAEGDSDSEMEEDSDVDEGKASGAKARQKLASAEDYNFDNMR
jgi:nuclear GTP-binding protein